MHTAILLLALGMATALLAGSLSDHAELITNRNLAAQRAERATQAFIQGCSSDGCQQVSQVLRSTTRLRGCIQSNSKSTTLTVQADMPWKPRVLVGLTPATAITVVDITSFAASAAAVLPRC